MLSDQPKQISSAPFSIQIDNENREAASDGAAPKKKYTRSVMPVAMDVRGRSVGGVQNENRRYIDARSLRAVS